jgi:hypothetical protein
MDINLNELLRKFRSHPYEDHHVYTPHTGLISFKVEEGDEVQGASGTWLQKPGTLLYYLEREGNVKKIYAKCNGVVTGIKKDLNGKFAEANTRLFYIRHKLGKNEIIERILTEVLHIFPAPQRARYFILPEIASRLEKKDKKEVSIRPGDEVVIMSLMKRDTILKYDGEPGVIFKVYFSRGAVVEQGLPLLGVCPQERLQYVHKIIQRVKNEWED